MQRANAAKMADEPQTKRARRDDCDTEDPNVLLDEIRKNNSHIKTGKELIAASACGVGDASVGLYALQIHPTDNTRFMGMVDPSGCGDSALILGESKGSNVELKIATTPTCRFSKYANAAGTLFLGAYENELMLFDCDSVTPRVTKKFELVFSEFHTPDNGRHVWVDPGIELQRWDTDRDSIDFSCKANVGAMTASTTDPNIVFIFDREASNVAMIDARAKMCVRVFDTMKNARVPISLGWSICLSGDETRLSVYSRFNSAVHVYDVNENKRIAEWSVGHVYGGTGLVQTNFRGSHVLATTNKSLVVWKTDSPLKQSLIELDDSFWVGSAITAFDLSKDGSTGVISTRSVVSVKHQPLLETVSVLDLSSICGMRPPVLAVTP